MQSCSSNALRIIDKMEFHLVGTSTNKVFFLFVFEHMRSKLPLFIILLLKYLIVYLNVSSLLSISSFNIQSCAMNSVVKEGSKNGWFSSWFSADEGSNFLE